MDQELDSSQFGYHPNSKHLVSVVLPVYQPNLDYLEQAIESVSTQDYPNIELIISNESDIDLIQVESVLDRYIGRMNVRLIYNRAAKGIFSNLNNAISAASGDFIQVFCQDDIMKPGLISSSIKGMYIEPNIGMVFPSYDVIDESGKDISNLTNFTYNPLESRVIDTDVAPDLFIRYGCLPGNLSPVMLAKKAVSEIGWFNEDLRYAGDFEYWVRLSKKYKMYYISERNLYIRKHKQQASFTIANQQLLYDLSRIYNMIIENEIQEKKMKYVLDVNRRVGSVFIHHILRTIWSDKYIIKTLTNYMRLMNVFPFKLHFSIGYYISSVPKRILSKLLCIKTTS